MNLPANAIIARRKVTEYLLQARDEGDKAAFLAVAGYTFEHADRPLNDLRTELLPLQAGFIEDTEYGPKYAIRGALTGPNGRTLRVLTIWMKENATGATKFVTLVPDKA